MTSCIYAKMTIFIDCYIILFKIIILFYSLYENTTYKLCDLIYYQKTALRYHLVPLPSGVTREIIIDHFLYLDKKKVKIKKNFKI